MKNQHTPTPWRNPQDSVTVRNDETGKKVCDTSWGVTGAKEALANAAFIVKACNSHETLLEACKWALPLVVQWFNEKPHCQDHSGLTLLREAIAKAQE